MTMGGGVGGGAGAWAEPGREAGGVEDRPPLGCPPRDGVWSSEPNMITCMRVRVCAYVCACVCALACVCVCVCMRVRV